jgi:hypothetical protein
MAFCAPEGHSKAGRRDPLTLARGPPRPFSALLRASSAPLRCKGPFLLTKDLKVGCTDFVVLR